MTAVVGIMQGRMLWLETTFFYCHWRHDSWMLLILSQNHRQKKLETKVSIALAHKYTTRMYTAHSSEAGTVYIRVVAYRSKARRLAQKFLHKYHDLIHILLTHPTCTAHNITPLTPSPFDSESSRCPTVNSESPRRTAGSPASSVSLSCR